MSNDPNIEFRCRKCGDTILIEIMQDVVVSSECRLTVHGLKYGEQTNEDGSVNRYQCGNGHTVRDEDGEQITRFLDLLALCRQQRPQGSLCHDDVVELIAEQLRHLDAESLVIEHDRAFPEPGLKSLGDSLYVLKEREPDAANQTD